MKPHLRKSYAPIPAFRPLFFSLFFLFFLGMGLEKTAAQ
jgi:hypothetical protein